MAVLGKPSEWVGKKFKHTETGVVCNVDEYLRFTIFFTTEKGEKLSQHYAKFALVHEPV